MFFKDIFFNFLILSFFSALSGMNQPNQSATWQEYFKKNNNPKVKTSLVSALIGIENVKGSLLKPDSKIGPTEKDIMEKNNFDILNDSLVVQKAIDAYCPTDPSKMKAPKEQYYAVVKILQKAEEILEKWFGEKGNGEYAKGKYKALWAFLKKFKDIKEPASATTPEQELKGKLSDLSKNLGDLQKSLSGLQSALKKLQKELEASAPLGVFDNSDSWWQAAQAEPKKKITQAHKIEIKKRFKKAMATKIKGPFGTKTVEAVIKDSKIRESARSLVEGAFDGCELDMDALLSVLGEIFKDTDPENDCVEALEQY